MEPWLSWSHAHYTQTLAALFSWSTDLWFTGRVFDYPAIAAYAEHAAAEIGGPLQTSVQGLAVRSERENGAEAWGRRR